MPQAQWAVPRARWATPRARWAAGKPGSARRSQRKQSKEQRKQDKLKQRVEKVKRELPPKVRQLLAKRPSKMRLRAQLAIWRVRYRLSYLKLLGDGKAKVDIEAKVNPTIKIADAYFFEVADLLIIVDRVANDYIPKQSAKEADTPAIVDSTGDPHKGMASLVGNRRHKVGSDDAGRDIGFSSQHVKTQHGNEVLSIRPMEGGSAPQYGTLSKNLTGKGEDLGKYYRDIYRGKRAKAMPSDIKDHADVGYGLWFLHEPSHSRRQEGGTLVPTWANKRDLTYSMMLTELMAEGQVDAKDAFASEKLGATRGSKDITSHPAAYGGAQHGVEYTTRKMNRRKRSLEKGRQFNWTDENVDTRNKDYQERYYREVQLIKKWFSMHKEEFLKAYPSKPTEEQLEAFVRKKIRTYFAKQ